MWEKQVLDKKWQVGTELKFNKGKKSLQNNVGKVCYFLCTGYFKVNF